MNFINLKINYSYLLIFFKEILFKENFFKILSIGARKLFLEDNQLSVYLSRSNLELSF